MSLWQLLAQVYSYAMSLVRSKEVAFWVVVFPLILLTIFTTIFANPSDVTVEVAVAGEDNLLKEVMLDIETLSIVNATSRDEALEMLRNGSVDVAVYMANVTQQGDTRMPSRVEIYYLENISDSETAARIVEGVVSGFEDRIREGIVTFVEESNVVPDQMIGWVKFLADPVKTVSEGVEPKVVMNRGGLVLYWVISMIGVEVLFIGLYTGVMSIISKKQEGLLKVILSSPMSSTAMLLSDTLGNFLAVGVSIASIVLGGLILGADYTLLTPDRMAVIIAFSLIGSLFMTGLGLILSMLPKTIEGANALANMIAFPLMFLGGIVIPDIILPTYLRDFANIYPVSRLVKSMRDMIIYDIPTTNLLWDAVYGLSTAIIIYIIGFTVYRRLMQRAVENP